MDHIRPARPELETLRPYDAKKVRAEIDLSSNEHPANLPGELMDRVRSRLAEVPMNRYPDPMAEELRRLIAEANGLEPGNVLIGNGGDELILDLVLAWGGPGRSMLDCPPTFVMYELDARMTGTRLVSVPRREDFSLDEEAVMAAVRGGSGDGSGADPGAGDGPDGGDGRGGGPSGVDIVAISNPNNPTGNLVPETLLIDILNATDAPVLIDEAYFEFSRHTMRPHMDRHPNLLLLRTFSKAFSMAGVRVGYMLGHADVIRELTKVRQPYSVDRVSQLIATTVFRERAVFESGLHEALRTRDLLGDGLSRLPGVEVFPSEANFVLFRVPLASAVWRDLLHNYGILVRDFSRTPGLEECLRVTVGSEDEARRFLEAMDRIISARRASELFGVAATASRHQEEE
jgi:histidinol-phosphate aminotransferase